MNEKNWLDSRKKGIGGSEVSALFGCNPFMNNIDLYNSKINGVEIKMNPQYKLVIDYGTAAEAPLRELFKLDFPEYEVYYKDFDTVEHPEYDFIRGTVDGRLVELETQRKGILEIKTVLINNSMQWEKWSNGNIPDNYFLQSLWYLLITGYDFAVLKAQLKTCYGGDIKCYIKHYLIEADDHREDMELLKQKTIDFWNNHILTRQEPGLILPKI